MDIAKRKLLETTLQSRFDLSKYIMLTRELLKSPKIKSNPAYTEAVLGQFRGSVKAYTDFGRYRDREDKELLLLAVQLIKNESVARSRAMQRNFVKDQLQKKSADAALVAFFEPNSPDWRLSFVKIDYNFVGSMLEEDITPARRFSFLVGENEKSHTAMRQLAIIMEDDSSSPTVAQIEEIFNIEKVTDEFFKVYREKYLDLKECLEGQTEFLNMAKKLNFTGEEFAKKLMGQLSFLYFLQRKGWLGVTANPRSIPAVAVEQLLANKPSNLRDLFKKVYTLTKDKYLRNGEALTNLSDQQIMTLNFLFTNTPYEGKWGSGEKNFIRTIFSNADKTGRNFYKDYLEPLFYNALNEERGGNTYYRPFNCMIPFLNGGLFQPIVDEYDMNKVAFEIPNSLFSNENLTKEGDKGDGILDIFDRYAFTVKEDEPLEKEVAVDPEMLGKVFENLLEVKDRKSKGAFYTPREIVHYMCQESLINYLVTETGISYEEINKLIRYGDIIADADNSKAAAQSGKFLLPESIRKNAKKVDDALDDIRIADPAVGSGAFPLGMINEIVRARMNLTLYLLPNEYVFNRDYAIPEQRKAYTLKLRTIQHSIHAVDIERSAVEITKLRLWLSLVVDEENFSEIRPLPNLEYNIMCGNSLLEEFEGIKLFNEILLEQQSEIAAAREPNIEQMDIFIPQSQNILDEIYVLQEKFFAISDSKEKIDLKNQIDKHEWDLIEKSLIENGKARELPKIREFKRLNSKPYFLWKLNFAKVFRDKGGFDVVIGNPPYVDSEVMTMTTPQLRETYSQVFESARGNWDLFVIFIDKGVQLLKTKGYISFIVPNKLISAKYTESLRTMLLNWNIKEFRDYSNVRVFKEADVYPIVFVLGKNSIKQKVRMVVMKTIVHPALVNEIDNEIFYSDIYWDKYFSSNLKEISLIQKLTKFPKLEKCVTILGAATVNEAYRFKEYVSEYDYIDNFNEPFKRFINSGTIDRYLSLWGEKNMTYIKGSYRKPIITDKDIQAVSLTRLNQAKSEKIIIAGMTKCLECFYDQGEYLAAKSTVIILKKDIDLQYIIGILNSKLITFFFNNFFNSLSLAGGYLRVGPPQIKHIPIVIQSSSTQDQMINLVQTINGLTSAQDYQDNIEKQKYVAGIEREIDRLVYQIYNLTPEEIEIVENFCY